MQRAINIKLVALFAVVAMAFAAAVPAYAYDELEIEVEIKSNKTLVEVEYEEDGVETETEYEYETTDLQEVYSLLATELDISEDEVEAATSIEDEDEDEDEDENEDEDDMATQEEAEDAIADAASEIEKAQTVITEAELDGKEIDLSSTTLAEARELLVQAEEAYELEEYNEAESLADESEDLAKLARMKYIDKTEADIAEDEDEDEDDDDKSDNPWTKEKCETHPGIGNGVKEKCDDDYKKSDRNDDKYKDYGKSNDREELQAQLQELMQLLIQLLNLQLANQGS